VSLGDRYGNTGRFPNVPGNESLLKGNDCFLACDVLVEKHGPDEQGRLLLSGSELVFVGATALRFGWNKVAEVSCAFRSMTVLRSDRTNPYTFRFANWSDAMAATFIAAKLRDKAIGAKS
jgi:hypothetical protein